MTDEEIRWAVDHHWAASAAGDGEGALELYADDVIVEFPQSGEVIRGREQLKALRAAAGGPGVQVRRVLGTGPVWVTEYAVQAEGRSVPTVSIMQFREGKVWREIRYVADTTWAPSAVGTTSSATGSVTG